MKYFALGDECPACGKKYFQRCRLLVHLQSTASCQAVHLACFVPAAEEVVAALDLDDLAYARAVKQQGWFPTNSFLPALRVPGLVLPAAGSPDAQVMQDKWKLRTQSGQNFQGLDGFCEDVPQSSTDDDPIVPFVMQTDCGQGNGQAGVFQQFGLAAEAARLHVTCLIFIHFYTGFRRNGDLQHCIEHQAVIEDKHLFCISIDLCLANTLT